MAFGENAPSRDHFTRFFSPPPHYNFGTGLTESRNFLSSDPAVLDLQF